MKVFGPKSVSAYLFYSSRVVAIGCLVLVLYILLSFTFDNFEVIDGRFQIALPIFSEVYIKGFYEQSIIASICLILLFIGVFFYLRSLILKSFKSEKLFTATVVQYLNFFAILNLVVFPILYFLLHFFILQQSDFGSIHNLFLSLILGGGVLFVSAIFKRGLKVQNENDLTI